MNIRSVSKLKRSQIPQISYKYFGNFEIHVRNQLRHQLAICHYFYIFSLQSLLNFLINNSLFQQIFIVYKTYTVPRTPRFCLSPFYKDVL